MSSPALRNVFRGTLLTVLTVHPWIALGGDLGKAPTNIQAAIFLKLFKLNTVLSAGGDITLYVINAKEFAQSMKPTVGQSIGASTFSNIVTLNELPNDEPSGPAVLYIGDPALVIKGLDFCRRHKILSITGAPEIAANGVTIAVGVANNKPKILYNPASSEKEGMVWKPEITKFATVVE